MKIRFFIMEFLFLVIVSGFVLGADLKVAYIVNTALSAEQAITQNLQLLGFSVDVITNDNIGKVNLSNYMFMVINNDVFSNYDKIPVNEFPAIILNKDYMDEWHWVKYISQKTSSQPITGYVTDPTYFIAQGLTSYIQLYTVANYGGKDIIAYYLNKYVKATNIKSIVGIDDSPDSDKNSALIATVVPGTLLRDGYSSKVKSVFFGISESKYWTNTTSQLFRRSAMWLVTDTIPPIISNITVINVTNQSARIIWDTDDSSNATIKYGTNLVIKTTEFVKHHEIYLTGLQEKTLYHYNITSCNDKGYCSENGPYSFTTVDLTPPTILSNSVTELTNSSAKIFIRTNEDSRVMVYYGISIADQYTSISELGVEHNIDIQALQDKTIYKYIIMACDAYNNCRNSSIQTFTTFDFTPPNAVQNLILEVIHGHDIEVKWDLPSGEKPSIYNIYTANELNSFDFKKPAGSTINTFYIDGNTSDHRKYYVVRAQDAAGNEESNQNIVGKYDLELKTGYNLVSFPLIPFNSNVNEVMHQTASYQPVSKITRYSNKSMETVAFDGALWSKDIDLNALEGYFFKSGYSTYFTIVGNPITSTRLELTSGLNLAGLSLFEEKGISNVFPQSPTQYNVTEIASWNNGNYDISTYYPAANNWFSVNNFSIKSGAAYWIKVKNNFEVEVK